MSTPYISSPRLLPRCERSEFIDLCRQRKWPLRTVMQCDEQRGVPAAFVFSQGKRDNKENLVHWVDDFFVQFSYLVFSGPDAETNAEALRQDTNALSDSELFELWDTETEPHQAGVLALFLGVVAPAEPAPAYRTRLQNAMTHVDHHVRACGLVAIGYRAWGGWEPTLANLAESDPDDDIRDFARQLLRDRQND